MWLLQCGLLGTMQSCRVWWAQDTWCRRPDAVHDGIEAYRVQSREQQNTKMPGTSVQTLVAVGNASLTQGQRQLTHVQDDLRRLRCEVRERLRRVRRLSQVAEHADAHASACPHFRQGCEAPLLRPAGLPWRIMARCMCAHAAWHWGSDLRFNCRPCPATSKWHGAAPYGGASFLRVVDSVGVLRGRLEPGQLDGPDVARSVPGRVGVRRLHEGPVAGLLGVLRRWLLPTSKRCWQ